MEGLVIPVGATNCNINATANWSASQENNGIGHYEFWGATGYDEGDSYVLIEDVKSIDDMTIEFSDDHGNAYPSKEFTTKEDFKLGISILNWLCETNSDIVDEIATAAESVEYD